MPTLGVTGKPNVGKSTFFSAATLATVPIANYPFTTKTANVGVAYVRIPCVCKEFNVQDNPVNSICLDGVRLVPVKLIDCPGLVPGAWQGRGLGNQFLDEVRRADALLLVVDASGSTDDQGRPVAAGSCDPLEDVKFLEKEFDMWILAVMKKEWDRIARRVEATKENLADLLEEKLAGLQIVKHHIIQALNESGLSNRNPTTLTAQELEAFAHTLRKVSKPMLIVANKMDVAEAEANLERLKGLGYPVVPSCAEAELALRLAAEKHLISYRPGDGAFTVSESAALSAKQLDALESVNKKILAKYGATGVQAALNQAYLSLLGMIAVFPVEDAERLTDHEGRILPDCYLVPTGTTAREFAAKIHTELGESFIYAVEARTKRRVGEDYALHNNDVIKIVGAKKRG